MMSNNPERSRLSLQAEIQKRKTQEMTRAIVQKQVDLARGETPQRTTQTARTCPADLRRTSQTIQTGSTPTVRPPELRRVFPDAAPQRAPALQRSPAREPVRPQKRAIQVNGITRNPARMRLFVALLAVTVVLIVSASAALLITSRSDAAGATQPVLPTVTASEVVTHLMTLGVPVTNVRSLDVSKESWGAQQEVEFNVQRGGSSATFIVLSYANASDRVPDLFRLKDRANKFKTWKLTSLTNIILLASPGTSPAILNEINSHLTQYLVAPYRSFYPTATPRK